MPPKVNENSTTRVKGGQVLAQAEYFRLARAADLLDCKAEDLLHLGARARLRLLAPVLIAGAYTWPNESDGIPYPEIGAAERRVFDSTSRVFLLARDLAKIEATGFAMPTEFFAPEVAKSVLEDARHWLDEPVPEPSKDMQQLAENNFYAPWRILEKPARDDPRTTMEHLFLPASELARIKGQASIEAAADSVPSEQKVHGNAIRNREKALKIAEAAIYCKHRWPDACAKPPGWADKIWDMSAVFWPEPDNGHEVNPPFTREWIVRFLNGALRENARNSSQAK